MNITLFKIAIRNVLRNKRRSATTILAIAVAVMVLTVLDSMKTSFLNYVILNVVDGETGALQVHRAGFVSNKSSNPLKFSFPDSEELRNKILAVANVEALAPRIRFMGFVSNGRNQALFLGSATDSKAEKRVCPLHNSSLADLPEESLQSKTASILIGKSLAETLNTVSTDEKKRANNEALVDSLTLSAGNAAGRQNALDVTIRAQLYSAIPFASKSKIEMPLDVAQTFLNMKGLVTEIAVSVVNLEKVQDTVEKLKIVLGPEYEVHYWLELQPFLRDEIFRLRIALSIIALVLSILAGFGVANTMLMCVFERVREIGTMQSLGVRNASIVGIFLNEAFLLGLIGGAIGATVATLIILVLHLTGIPLPSGATDGATSLTLEFNFSFMLFVVVCSSIAALVAALYPANKASKLRPVEALRSN